MKTMNNGQYYGNNGNNNGRNKAISSMVLGIIAVVFSSMGSLIVLVLNVFEAYPYDFEEVRLTYIVFFIVPIILSIIGLVNSGKAESMGYHMGQEKSGKVLAFVAMAICLISIVISTVSYAING